jgi:hypothetical protein
MEWVLQVVDEVDDAICAARHHWLGLHAGFGVMWAAALSGFRRRRLTRPGLGGPA